MGFSPYRQYFLKYFATKNKKLLIRKRFMYVKIEDIVGNIKTKKYSGILIIFVNTIKAV